MSPTRDQKLVLAAVALFVIALLGAQSTFIVPPGHRGVMVTLGKVAEDFRPEGLGFKVPFITTVHLINVRQQTVYKDTTCISKDLQQISIKFAVLYRIPEESVVQIFQSYKGDPFDTLVMPRVDEALKEVTKERRAQNTVQERNLVKAAAEEIAQTKMDSLIIIADLILENIFLSPQMENAIEEKMVQEQRANKALFEQAKAEIDAQTAIIQARGEAEAIRIRGQALATNPDFIDLKVVETWNGRLPRVVSGNREGARLFLPIRKEKPDTDSAQR